MCFTKLFTGTRVSEDFQFWVSGSRNNRKHTALTVTVTANPLWAGGIFIQVVSVNRFNKLTHFLYQNLNIFWFSLTVNSIALVKPDKAKMVERMLIQMAQRGQLPGRVSTYIDDVTHDVIYPLLNSSRKKCYQVWSLHSLHK